MKMNIYGIFDRAIAAYGRPFFMQTDGQAIRAFHDDAVSAESVVSKHPEDYSLYIIGIFDDQAGEIEPVSPRCIARAHELVARERASKPLVPQPNGDDSVHLDQEA